MTDSKGARHSGYIALKRIPFGDSIIEAGQPIPYEEGRNYGAMVQRGQAMLDLARQASQPASQLPATEDQGQRGLVPASQIQASTLNPVQSPAPFTFSPGAEVFYISEDGSHQKVTVKVVKAASPDEAKAAGLNGGGLVAAVQFPDANAPEFVPVRRLLPLQPTDTLISDLEAQIEDSEDAASAFGFMESTPYLLKTPDDFRIVFVGGVRLPDEQERETLALNDGVPVADVRSNPEDPDTDEVVKLTDLIHPHALAGLPDDTRANEQAGTVQAGEAAYLVTPQGIMTVVVKSFFAANAEDAAAISVEEDADIASVVEVDEEEQEGEEPFIVPVGDLLPIAATDRLLKTFGIVDDEGTPMERPDADYVAELEADNAFLGNLVMAMGLDGDPLDAKTPSAKTLNNAGVKTLAGLVALAEAGGVDWLNRIKGFSDKQAQNLYDWLVTEGHVTAPAPEVVQPEGGQVAEGTEAPASQPADQAEAAKEG